MDWIENARTPDDLTHDCDEHLELRERQKGHGTAYANQCTFCGEAKGSEVAKRLVTQPVAAFDHELYARYEQRRRDLYRQIHEDTLGQQAEVPSRKIERRLAECLADLDREFGERLVTSSVQSFLKRQRAEHIDSLRTGWSSEAQLADWLENELSRDFHVLREVPGVGYVNRQQRNLRLDFIIRAKPHLLAKGFTEQYMGIEVKFLDYADGKGFSSKSSKGIFQALSYWYSGSTWNVGENQPVSLACVLLFSNLSFPEERDHFFQSYDQANKTLWHAYSSIAAQANVGELLILDYGQRGSGWSMRFHAARYFSKLPGNRLVLSNQHLINRTRIGHSGKR